MTATTTVYGPRVKLHEVVQRTNAVICIDKVFELLDDGKPESRQAANDCIHHAVHEGVEAVVLVEEIASRPKRKR